MKVIEGLEIYGSFSFAYTKNNSYNPVRCKYCIKVLFCDVNYVF